MLIDTLLSILSALALAGLIGAERELMEIDRKKKKHEKKSFGGIRTHMLLALLGSISVIFAQATNAPLLLTTFILIGAIFCIHYSYKLFVLKSPGLTSTITGLLTFFLGVLCAIGEGTIAVMIGILITALLVSKRYVYTVLEKIDRKELYNTLKFAVILFVVLPLLPTEAIDPWGVINLREIWYVVVLISGISYVGYVASKIVGTKKGILLSGILGGLASSTAVTSSMAAQSKQHTSIVNPFVVATVVASSMMFFRVLFWVYSFNAQLVYTLLIPILSMGITSAIVVGFLMLTKHKHTKESTPDPESPTLESPFQILPALKFGFFFVFVTALSTIAMRYLGEGGTYLVSLISGFADVDAITVSLSNQTLSGSIAPGIAAKGIIIAMMTNTLVKLVLAKLFGGKAFGNKVMISFLIILGAGGISLFFI